MKSRLGRVAARYRDNAETYRRFWAPVLVQLAEPLLRALPLSRGARVADLGCGVGTISARVAARAGRGNVIGIDLTPQMLARARLPMRIASDIARLPLAAGGLDGAISTFVLQHVPRPGSVFAEAARVLRPGGFFATATWGGGEAAGPGPYAVLDEILEEAGVGPDPSPVAAWEHRVAEPAQVRRYARRAGFTEARAWTERPAYRWDRDEFVANLRAGGSYWRRLQTLPARARARAFERIERRVGALRSADLVWAPEIVYCIAACS